MKRMPTLSGGMSLSLLLLPQSGKDVLLRCNREASLSASVCGGPAREPFFPAGGYLFFQRQDLNLFPLRLFPLKKLSFSFHSSALLSPSLPPASFRRRQVRAKRYRATEDRSHYVYREGISGGSSSREQIPRRATNAKGASRTVEEEAKALVKISGRTARASNGFQRSPPTPRFRWKSHAPQFPSPNTDRHGWQSQTACGGQGRKNARSPPPREAF